MENIRIKDDRMRKDNESTSMSNTTILLLPNIDTSNLNSILFQNIKSKWDTITR